ncbi:hypothetical protein [Arthrobacter sp. H35-D1]|uniref:hypothetical protein n=1 Tax=Arthrobacter sp. H35-D1 TaxID=3046202 RepID=UPI0024B98B64|nr:hypothetical protein [Arthrobacter sp. H35-D1]MDJ0313553.1 hypothetical protein [Arthrobacter sp. H35-D1]
MRNIHVRGADNALWQRAHYGSAAKAAPECGGQILPGSMVAIVTGRDGDTILRIAVPAEDPAMAPGQLPGEAEDIPLQTPFRLPVRSAAVPGPALEASSVVEAAL